MTQVRRPSLTIHVILQLEHNFYVTAYGKINMGKCSRKDTMVEEADGAGVDLRGRACEQQSKR